MRSFYNSISGEQMKRNILQAIPFWFASLLTALIAVGFTWLFTWAEELLVFLLKWNKYSLFIISPLCFFFAWFIVRLFAPNARGSGIPQVMAAIDMATPKQEHRISALLSLRIMLTKIASCLLMVMGGGAIGREGPTIQIAGSVFQMVNKWIPKSWPKLSTKSFILTGSAAGLAAAFNTPLGGVVFAMEELAKIHIRFFRTALFSAVIIAGLTAQALLGPYLYLGYPDVRNLPFSIFLGVALIAIVSGLAGGMTSRLILAILQWRKKLGGWRSAMYVIISGLLIAALAIYINESILGSGKEIMNEVLFTSQKHASWDTSLFRILGPVIAFNTGAAGGIFAPALAAGASVGSFFSGLFDYTGAEANMLILSGMVGFLTGITRTPFTSAILVLEMTDRHSVIFHLMLAAMLSNIAALIADKHSFYERLKKDYESAGENAGKNPDDISPPTR